MARKEARLTQQELAHKVGYSGESQISLIEANKSGVSMMALRALAQVLGVNTEWLQAGEGPMRPTLGVSIGRVAEDAAPYAPYIIEAATPEEAATLESVKTIIQSNNQVAIEAVRSSVTLALAALGRRPKRRTP